MGALERRGGAVQEVSEMDQGWCRVLIQRLNSTKQDRPWRVYQIPYGQVASMNAFDLRVRVCVFENWL